MTNYNYLQFSIIYLIDSISIINLPRSLFQWRHKSKEDELKNKIQDLVKDLKREEQKLLQTVQALNRSNKDEAQLQGKINEMLSDFEAEEGKLQSSLDSLSQSQEDEEIMSKI